MSADPKFSTDVQKKNFKKEMKSVLERKFRGDARQQNRVMEQAIELSGGNAPCDADLSLGGDDENEKELFAAHKKVQHFRPTNQRQSLTY